MLKKETILYNKLRWTESGKTTPPRQYTCSLDAIRELEEEEVHSAMMSDRFGLGPSKYNIIILKVFNICL